MRRIIVSLLLAMLTQGIIAPVSYGASSPSPKPVLILAQLYVSYQANDISSNAVTYSVICYPNKSIGTHPNLKAICRYLNSSKSEPSILLNQKSTASCKNNTGYNPERASVTGSWGSKQVNKVFSHATTCSNSQWQAANILFTFPGQVLVTGDISTLRTCQLNTKLPKSLCSKSESGTVVFNGDKGKTIKAKAFGGKGFSLFLPDGKWDIGIAKNNLMNLDCKAQSIQALEAKAKRVFIVLDCIRK